MNDQQEIRRICLELALASPSPWVVAPDPSVDPAVCRAIAFERFIVSGSSATDLAKS